MHGRSRGGNLEQAVIEKPNQLAPGPRAAMSEGFAINQRPHASAIGDCNDNPAFWCEDTPGLAQ